MPSARDSVRVLIVHPRDPAAPTLGGIQTFLRDFMKYAPADFDISFVGTTADTRARPVGRWHNLELYGRRVRFLAVAPSGGPQRSPESPIRSLQGLARLWRALRVRNRILQVHRPYRTFVLDRHRGPIVQFIHLDLRDWPGPQGWPKLRSLYRDFSDKTLERMDRVFIVNEIGALTLKAEHPEIAERVSFLPVWYDPETFHPVTDDERLRLRIALAERLGIDPATSDTQRFVLVAQRMTDIKKPLLALEAMHDLRARGRTDIQMLVAGSGELLNDARARAAKLGVADAVHFLGDRPREEIAQLMQASDVLLLTARSEGGGPRVVLEALATGVPVVSTRVAEAHRTITHQSNGWLVDDPTGANLADGLDWALSQDRREIASLAVTSVRPFTAQNLLSGLFDTYREIHHGSGRA